MKFEQLLGVCGLIEMDQQAIISVLFAAVVSLIGWNIKTTNDLQLQVQRLEIILLNDAFVK